MLGPSLKIWLKNRHHQGLLVLGRHTMPKFKELNSNQFNRHLRKILGIWANSRHLGKTLGTWGTLEASGGNRTQ